MTKTNREDILRKALAYFLRKGYDGTSLADVARSVGIRKATLFFYFKNKEDLYSSVIDRFIMHTQNPEKKFGTYANESFKDFIDFYISKVDLTMQRLREISYENNLTALDYMRFLLESGSWKQEYALKIFSFNEKETKFWEEKIREAQQKDEIRPDINPESQARIFQYSFVGISYMCSLKGGVTVEQIRELLYDLYSAIKK
jgi:AcrR family transcriptional regulator